MREINVMNLLPDFLKNDYYRYSQEINNDGYDGFLIKPDDVLRAHYIIADYFLDANEKVLYGVKTPNLLYSAINRQNVSFGNKNKWETPLERCATLFYGLVKNHAFHDGNKRTALLIALYNLHLINRTPTQNQREFEILTKRVASSELSAYKCYEKFKGKEDSEILVIAHILKKLTKRTDKKFYAMTFKEFAHRLEDYGCYMSVPHDNYVKIYKKNKGLFGKDKLIRQIGCPSMRSQINEKAMKSVLKDIGVEDNYNFYSGGEPLYKLIEAYRTPLMRLKDE